MKNLIEITNEIIKKHEERNSVFKYLNVNMPSPIAYIYHVNSLDEMKDLPKGSVAICEGKVYMNIVMQAPTEILTVTGDLEW